MNLWWIVVVVSLFESSSAQRDIDPCLSYTELREAHRSQFYRYQEEDVGHCDIKLSLAWYRFRGKAGLKMPDSCVAPGFCGTHSPGWFQGSHPSISDGAVNGNVCFNWMGECCFWLYPVLVKNCSGFYVYKFPPTLFCDLQYCGDGATDLDCAADNNDIIVNSSASGSLSSPNFPTDYPKNLQCTWRITAPEGKRVRLVLKNATFGAEDYVMFRDGIQDDVSPEIAKYSNCTKGELRLYSSDRHMLITFVSVGNSTGTGFQLDYDMVLSSKINCSSYKDNCSLSNDVRRLSGVIRSPSLPRSPAGNLNCHWNLLMPAGYKILTIFSWFGMTGKSRRKYCADDYVEVRVVGASESEKYCGCDIPSKRLYDREMVNITFYNNLAADQAGFLFYYKAVAPEECLDGVESCEMDMPPMGTNSDGELCYEPEEKPTTPPATTTKAKTSGANITEPEEKPTTPPATTTKATTSEANITASLPRPTTILLDENVLDVACREDNIHVALAVRSSVVYDPGSVRLNDPSCKPYFVNSTHIFVRLSLGTCGTTRNTTEDDQEVVYENSIHFEVKRASLRAQAYVTRDYEAVLVFQCRYKRLAILSTISFNPARVYIVTNAASFGNFTFEMNIFKSEEYKEYYSNFPIGPVDLGAKIFFQVAVESNDADLVVFVDECKATPTPDYNDKTQYNFMDEGCSKDNTLQYNYSLSSVQRFTMSAFRFRAVSSKEIFFHCQVKACRRSDQSSRCAEGCPYSKRRRRAADDVVERHLAIGPIIVTSGVSLKEKQSSIAFETLAGILGFLALVLVAAFLVFILKHRAKSKREATSVLMFRKHETGSDELRT